MANEKHLAIRRMVGRQFPAWAQPTNTIYRYAQTRLTISLGRVWRLLYAVIGICLLAGLLNISITAFEQNEPLGLYVPGTWDIHTVLYFPLLVVQYATFALAFLLGSGRVVNQRQRQTWEVIKCTSHGAGLIIRAQWVIVFHQLRWLLVVIIVPRLLFLGLMLLEITDYPGYRLDWYVDYVTPAVSPAVAIALLAAFVTAALLQIFVWVGFNIALGLFVRVVFRRWALVQVIRVLVLVAEFGLMGLALKSGKWVLDAAPALLVDMSMMERWLDLLLIGAWGDHSLRFLDAPTFLQAWSGITYGVWLGAGLLTMVLVQILVTNTLLIWTGQWASRSIHM